MSMQVSRLEVSVARKQLLKDITFDLPTGAWLMVIGPNGAGKSTLLRALTGFLTSGGTVLLDGQNLRSMTSRELARKAAVLQQEHEMASEFTVEQYIGMGRYAHRTGFLKHTDPGGEKLIEQTMRDTGLWELRGRSMLSLSGGERQRAGLAQVLVQQPDFLFLDEPSNHLDLTSVRQLFLQVDAWRREPGHTVVSVVHDLMLARRFGTHFLLLDCGRQAAFGNAEEVLRPERLTSVWRMDVNTWLDELMRSWQSLSND